MRLGTPSIKESLSSTAVLMRGAGCLVHGLLAVNPNTSDVFIQCWNQSAAASVTVGTTKPDFVFPVPAAGSATTRGMLDAVLPEPILFTAGLVIAATTGFSTNGAPGTAIDLSLALSSHV